jgi:hypothetical protein
MELRLLLAYPSAVPGKPLQGSGHAAAFLLLDAVLAVCACGQRSRGAEHGCAEFGRSALLSLACEW